MNHNFHTVSLTEKERFEGLYQAMSHNDSLFNIACVLQRAAHIYGERKALIYKDTSITYQELYIRAAGFARILKQQGVKKHDRVLMCFENSPEFYIAYFAIWHIGAVVAPLNIFLKEHELAHIVNDADPKIIITSSDRVALFQHVNQFKKPSILTQDDMLLDIPIESIGYDDSVECIDIDAMVALLYTSGTTGEPKGVMLSSRNIMTNVLQGVARFNLYDHERTFAVLPLFHIFSQNACVWTSIFMGATIILVPKIERRYILEGLEHKPTMFLGVPALYGLLCLLKNVPLDSVRYFICGGDALPDKIRAAFSLLYRRSLCNGYGMTETSPMIAMELDDERGPTNTVGKLCVGIECAIRDEQEQAVAPGTIGQIWIKGDTVMLGYYQAEQATKQIIKDGWLNTGDLGYLDTRGKLVITGRMKDLIKHKGFNIYPQEIENVLLSHPNVIRVGVVGLQDQSVGEYPIAFVQLRTREKDIEKILTALCKHHLAPYKVPKEFRCQTDELPVTATGKVDKKVLRKLLLNDSEDKKN